VHLPGNRGHDGLHGKPLRVPMFRNLFDRRPGFRHWHVHARRRCGVADGCRKEQGPLLVALTQTAVGRCRSFLLALPAGALGDIFDRRKLIVTTEVWMVSVATAIARRLTLLHWITPWMLLLLTVALSIGDALEAPTWRRDPTRSCAPRRLAAGHCAERH